MNNDFASFLLCMSHVSTISVDTEESVKRTTQ